MKTTAINTDKAPTTTRQVLKGLPQNLEGQFTADKISAEKRMEVFSTLHGWCEGLDTSVAKLMPIPQTDVPVNIRPILKTFHENLQAVYTPLSGKERGEVVNCIQDWCAVNTKTLEDATKGTGATAS